MLSRPCFIAAPTAALRPLLLYFSDVRSSACIPRYFLPNLWGKSCIPRSRQEHPSRNHYHHHLPLPHPFKSLLADRRRHCLQRKTRCTVVVGERCPVALRGHLLGGQHSSQCFLSFLWPWFLHFLPNAPIILLPTSTSYPVVLSPQLTRPTPTTQSEFPTEQGFAHSLFPNSLRFIMRGMRDFPETPLSLSYFSRCPVSFRVGSQIFSPCPPSTDISQ